VGGNRIVNYEENKWSGQIDPSMCVLGGNDMSTKSQGPVDINVQRKDGKHVILCEDLSIVT